MAEEEFALLYLKRKPEIARIVGRTPSGYRLELPGGAQASFPEGRLLLRWKGAPPAAPLEETHAAETRPHSAGSTPLAPLWERLTEQAAAFDPTVLHRTLGATHPPAKKIAFAEIVAHALPGQSEGWARAALYLALLGAPRHFRHVPKATPAGGFALRDAAEIALRDEKQAVARERAEEARRVERWREMLERGEWKPEQSALAAAFLDRLASLLAEERGSPHWKTLAKPLGLRAANMVEERVKLKRWLQTAGRWEGWPAIWLRRARVRASFDPVLEKAARALAETHPHPGGRVELRHLDTVTMDTPGTRDPDDACSILSADGEGVTVAVHIAEPPAALRPGHPLFDEAARRIGTVYTLEGVFPMVPFQLGGGRVALKAGKVREAATFTLYVTAAGEGKLLSVERSLIRVKKNLDYEAGDKLLESDPDGWGRLAQFCEAFRAGRLARGAVAGGRVGVAIDRSDPERVKLKRYDRGGPAQRLVEELAILVNREAGRYCRDHGLPAIYRVLAGVRATATGGGALPGQSPLEKKRPRPRFSVKGGRHAGLAADRYVQVTSPLRRFPDLVMQQQILSHATGGTVTYGDGEQLASWAKAADERMAAHAEAQRRIEEHWKRVYLSQNPGAVLSAEVRRLGKAGSGAVGSGSAGLGRVWLEPVQLMAEARLTESARPGTVFSCQATEVELDRATVRVEPA